MSKMIIKRIVVKKRVKSNHLAIQNMTNMIENVIKKRKIIQVVNHIQNQVKKRKKKIEETKKEIAIETEIEKRKKTINILALPNTKSINTRKTITKKLKSIHLQHHRNQRAKLNMIQIMTKKLNTS
jgi:hypothetical protein